MKWIILTVLLVSTQLRARQVSESFNVTAYQDHYKVVGPRAGIKEASVVIENKTLNNLVGRIIDNKNNIYHNLAVKAGRSKVFKVNFERSRKYYFVPLSPAFQSIDLIPGKRSYEIPSQR